MDKENICNNIPSTSIDMQDIDTAKIGSVYILTQERYEKLLKAEQTLLMIKAALCNERKREYHKSNCDYSTSNRNRCTRT